MLEKTSQGDELLASIIALGKEHSHACFGGKSSTLILKNQIPNSNERYISFIKFKYLIAIKLLSIHISESYT